MIDIGVSGLTKSFDLEKKILDGLTFQIDSGERVGLLGCNGAGKTTLFKILTGEMDYDSGQVLIAPGKRLGLISQIPVYPAEYTVEDVLRTAFARTKTMQEEMNALAEQMAAGDHSQQTLRRYGDLNARFEGLGGWDTDTAVNKVAGGLSMDEAMRARPFAELSGGEKTRVNLGRLILEDTDILLLDEPTNHLDIESIEWLESFIRRQSETAFLFVTHDRAFLKSVATFVYDLDRGQLAGWNCDYRTFLQRKADLQADEAALWLKKAKKLAVNKDTCVSCGQCAKLCPKGNIKFLDGHPTFGNGCIQCLGCLQYCPTESIYMGKKTQKREHYHNPNITPEELMQTVIHID